MSEATGYGPSSNAVRFNRLCFDGEERSYEQWEVKFLCSVVSEEGGACHAWAVACGLGYAGTILKPVNPPMSRRTKKPSQK